MLQKLLIALCTIFVLSACGGDLDLGPDTPPPPPEDPNGDEDPGEEPEEPAEPRILVFMPFNEEAQTDSWETRCEETCNATATLSWNEAEEVLAIEPEWASAEDQLEVYSPIDEINDLEGSHASAWVFVTEAYVADGNLAAHLVLGNAAGGTAYSRAFEVDAGWNRIEMWEMMAGTGETVTPEEGEEYVDYGSFFWHSDGFTLRNINEFGVAFAANGKATDVAGQLWLDNVTVTPASGTGPLIVEADDEAWTVMDAAPEVTLQRDGEGGVFYEPTAADQKLVYLLEGPADLVGRSFDMTFTVDQAFKDSGADVQPIIQQNFGSYTGEFGCYVSNASLTAGVPFEVSCATENEAFVAEEGQNIRVGLQVKNEVAGRVTINSMQINVVSSAPSGPETLEASVTEGWRVNPESLMMEYTDDGVAYNPIAADNQLMYDFQGPLELEGKEYTIVFDVDQAFIDSGAELQPIIQRTDDFSVGDYSCYVSNGALVAGENEVTCGSMGSDFNLDETGAVQVGFQSKGEGIEGTVTVKSLIITL